MNAETLELIGVGTLALGGIVWVLFVVFPSAITLLAGLVLYLVGVAAYSAHATYVLYELFSDLEESTDERPTAMV